MQNIPINITVKGRVTLTIANTFNNADNWYTGERGFITCSLVLQKVDLGGNNFPILSKVLAKYHHIRHNEMHSTLKVIFHSITNLLKCYIIWFNSKVYTLFQQLLQRVWRPNVDICFVTQEWFPMDFNLLTLPWRSTVKKRNLSSFYRSTPCRISDESPTCIWYGVRDHLLNVARINNI